jgi:nitroreductase
MTAATDENVANGPTSDRLGRADIFQDILRARRSTRNFLPAPVPRDILNRVVGDAQRAPSNCNTQPWQIHILSGAIRDSFRDSIVAAWNAGALSPDFSFATEDYPGDCRERAHAQGLAYYQALGIRREDYDERRAASDRNLDFFGAPHVALIFMPTVGDNVRIGADIGMYAQTFLLSLAANGLGGVPQTMLGFFGNEARQICDVSPDLKLMFGISFGYPDLDHAAGQYDIGRMAASESVVFHG